MTTVLRGLGAGPVAITGVGWVSPLGVGADAWLAAAAEAEPALSRVPSAESASDEVWVGAMPDFDVGPLLETRKAYLDRHTMFLLGATSLALRQAGWTRESLPRERAGLMVGSAWGGLGTMSTYFRDVVTKGPKFAKPILFPHAYANTAAAMVAIEWSLQGPHEHYATGSLASAQALLGAVDALRANDAQVVVAGGCEALSPALLRALALQGRSCGGSHAMPVPFDAGSHGVAPGEGSAVLVLERPADVTSRGGRALAHLAGVGISGSDLAGACRAALEEAQIEIGDVDAVLACGGGMPSEDRAEAAALARLFGSARPPVTALAAIQGDWLGASGAAGVAAAVVLLEAGWLPPIPGLQRPVLESLDWVRDGVRPVPGARHVLVTCLSQEGAVALLVQK